MKRIISIMLLLATVCTMSLSALTVEEPAFSVHVEGAVDTLTRYANQDTLAVSWCIRANKPNLTLANTQGVRLAYDSTVLQLIRWNAASAYSDSSIGTSLAVQSGAGNPGAYSSSAPQVFAARNASGDTGYLSLAIGDSSATHACTQGEWLPLLSIRFAFRDGKTQADLTPNSIRLMTVSELSATAQSTGALINAYAAGDPGSLVSYQYLRQRDGVLIGGDTLNPPVIEYITVSPALSVDTTVWDHSSSAGSTTISVTSNTSWTVSSDSPSWLTASHPVGSGNGNFTLTIAQHTSTSSRTGIITVTAGSLSRTITVTQAAVAGFCENHVYYDGVVTPPTYDKQGYTTYTCKVCGYIRIEHMEEWEPITSVRIELPSVTRVSRNAILENIIITVNSGANQADVVLAVNNAALAEIDADGRSLRTFNRAGTVTLTATAITPDGLIRHSVTLLIT